MSDDNRGRLALIVEGQQAFMASLKEVKTQFQTLGKDLKSVAGAMDQAFSAIGHAVREVVTVGGEYEKACQTIQGTTGATAAEMDRFSQVLKAAYASPAGENIHDVAGAMSELIRQLGSGLDDSQLEKLTQEAITLRDAFQYDVGESVQTAKALMDQFGVSGEEAFGLLAQGTQNNLNSSGTLMKHLQDYAGAFGQLGLSAQDMFAVLQSGAVAGAGDLSQVGEAVQTLASQTLSGSDSAAAGFQRLGLNADEMAARFSSGGESAKSAFDEVIQSLRDLEDPVAQNTAGAALFGDAWKELGPQVITQLDGVRSGYADAAAAMAQLSADQYGDMGSSITALGRVVQTEFLLPIAEKLSPTLQNLSEKLQEAFQNPAFQESVGNLAGSVALLAEGIGNFVVNNLPGLMDGLSWVLDHAGPIAVLVASIGTAFSALTVVKDFIPMVEGLKGMGSALGMLGKAVGSLNPWVVGISLLVTAVMTLWNTSEEFRTVVLGAWQAIQDLASVVWGGIVTFFTQTIPEAWNSVLAFFQAAPEFFGGIWGSIQTFFVEGWNSIAAFFTEAIPAWIQSVGEWFGQLPYLLGESLGTLLLQVQEWGRNLLAFVTDTLPGIISGIVGCFAQLPGQIGAWLTQAVQQVIGWGGQILASAGTAAAGAVNAAAAYFAQLPGRMGAFLTQAVAKLIAWGSQMLSTGRAKMAEVVTAVAETLQSLPGKVLSIGEDVIKGIWNGITNMAGWIKDKIAGWCGSFVQGFKNALGIHSPSKVFAALGKYLMTGLQQGVESHQHLALDAVKKTAQSLGDVLQQEIDRLNGDLARRQEEAQRKQAEQELSDHEAAVRAKYQELAKAEESGKQSILNEIAKLQETWNEKQRKAQEDAQRESVKSQVSALQEVQKAYETALQEIEKKQSTMADKLKDYGSLFSWVKSETGSTLELGDLQGEINTLEAYGQALTQLKNGTETRAGISDSLLHEVLAMKPEDALAYAQRLREMSDADYHAYLAQWEEKQALADDIARSFYQSELDALETEFVGKIPQSMETMKSDLYHVGTNAAQGLADGAWSMRDAVVNTFVAIGKLARNAFRKENEIHSPSKKWAQLGDYMAQGVGVGFSAQMRLVAQDIAGSIPMPAPQSSRLERIGEGVVNGVAAAVQGTGGQTVRVEVPLYLNGREIARGALNDLLSVAKQRGVAFG